MSDAEVAPQEARQELYDLVRSEKPFDEKARDALRLGKQYLDVDNGHLTRIDRETGHWEVMVSTDPEGGRFAPGLELDLERTYCRRTIDADAQLALHNAPNQGWEADPAYDAHGLDCYHGTTLLLDGDTYGTICFVATDSREAFEAGETMFTELITRLLERELEREQHEAELERQANLATVLNRVLRHNLRNELTVIRGKTQFMAEQLDDDGSSDVVLDHVDSLVSLSRKAGTLERVIESEFVPEPADIPRIARRVADSVANDHPSASISVTYDEAVTATVQPSFERALEELVENAAKHAGEAPTVTVAVELVPNAVEVSIADDGPGLSDHEIAVLERGSETPMVHGSGLGLWLAYWIVTSHDGQIEADRTEEGTMMTVTIPRKPPTNLSPSPV